MNKRLVIGPAVMTAGALVALAIPVSAMASSTPSTPSIVGGKPTSSGGSSPPPTA
jgi:hypothetical protein